MPKPALVVVGSFNLDQVWTAATLPRRGETLAGRHASGPGGKGFNQAVAAARCDAATRLICALGDDDAGRLAHELARTDHIELLAQPSTEPTGSAGIFVDANGDNSIVIGPGANATLTPAFVADQHAAIASARVLLAQLESPVAAVHEALRLGRQTGAITLLNPAPADATVSPELLASSDILTPNETEFAALLARFHTQSLDADAIATLDDDSLHALCRRLLPHGIVVITLGRAGCFASLADGGRDGNTCFRVAAEPARTVDSTGAGDAFTGALAASLASDGQDWRSSNATFPDAASPGATLAAHLRFAGRYAALSTERAGAAASMPRRAEIAARFDH